MGGFFSFFMNWVSPSPTYDLTPDPVTGLNEWDCHLIMSTWGLVADRKSIKKTGMAFFISLFKAHPYMQNLFHKLKGRTLEELKSCPIMQAHATTVMYAIKAYVEHVDDAQALAALVTRIAKSHVERNIFTEEVDKLAVVFLDFLKSALGSQWTPEVARAWKQLLTVHNVVYKQVEDQLRAVKCSS